MVNVIDNAQTVTDIDQGLQHLNNIFFIQSASAQNVFTADTTVELHTTYRRQVITLIGEEQVLKQSFCAFFGWRLARTHHAIDFYQCFQSIAGWISTQSVRNKWTAIEFVGVNRLELCDFGFAHFLEHFDSDFVVRRSNNFTAASIDKVFRQRFTCKEFNRNNQFFNACFLELTDMTRSNTASCLNDDVTVVIHDIEGSGFTTQTRRDQLQHHTIFGNTVFVVVVEGFQDILSIVAKRAQQNSCWQLTATVDTHVYQVLRIEFKVEP